MPYKNTDSYIEKTFLYLLVFSFLLHAAMFALVIYLPQEKKVAKEEPVMVELQDLPPSKEAPPRKEKEVKRLAEERHRVAREQASKGEMERDRTAAPQRRTAPQIAQPSRRAREMEPLRPEKETPAKEAPLSESILKPREERYPQLSKLFPCR